MESPRVRAVFLVALSLLAPGRFLASAAADTPEATFWSGSSDPASLAAELVGGMTDEELLGQIFMLGFAGALPDPGILEWARLHDLGGVKIFGWNAEDLESLTRSIDELQQAAQSTRLKIPLLVATDQEGGWVRHIKADTSESPGNMAIGASGLPSDAYRTGLYIGRELRALGINMNFAPAVDVYTNPKADVIGTRSFGSDPVDDGLLAVAFFKGLEQSRIISTAKHFPGHGDADADSHLTLPIVHASPKLVWDRDLVPYRFLIKEGLPAIMSGHLAYPELSGDDVPATLSRYFATDLLRGRLGFQGLIVTDDLLMAGAGIGESDLADICEAGVLAGDDILLVSQTPSIDAPVWTRLIARMHRDPGFRALVRAAAERIIRVKASYLKGPGSVPLFPDAAQARRTLPDREGEDFFFEQACRAVTVVKPGMIPLKIPASGPRPRILLAGQLDDFFSEGLKRFPDAARYRFSYDPFYSAIPSEVAGLRAIADDYDVIILCVANPNSEQALDGLRGTRAKVIALSALSPEYLHSAAWVASAIAVYGTDRDSFAAGFAAIKGDFVPSGRLPITLLSGVFR